ncbi:MAG: putative porin [Flavobacteriaceae bacterium]|nr:putative porin [Flavobacteriaceae bacterium]
MTQSLHLNLFILIVLLVISTGFPLNAQEDQANDLNFYGDFRFRVEHDWNSLKSDGTFREDRSRLRYRGRIGLNYTGIENVVVGARLRTGNPKKQQDPQLTLGDNFAEFNTLPLGLEMLFAQFQINSFTAWVGKNTFPFKKQNELFWSDNVFPEGISVSQSFRLNKSFLDGLDIHAGHFIIRSDNRSFSADSYFQGIQLVTYTNDKAISIYPSFYFFNEVPNIPDGNDTFTLDYTILHFGGQFRLGNSPLVILGADFYRNLEDLGDIGPVAEPLRDQKTGVTAQLSFGELTQKGKWKGHVIYAYLERFAAVDFLAQNDWARWDYSSQGSPDGRLTNMKGIELMAGYALSEQMDLQLKVYSVKQILPLGDTKESGDRIRLDINIRF